MAVANQPSPTQVIKFLSQEARRALAQALSQGDRWGYRCFYPADEKAILTSHQGKYLRWGDIAQKGFLTPLGYQVAVAASEPQKAVREL